MASPITNVVGVDDAPFSRDQREPVPLVGAVYAGMRLDGVMIASIAHDGDDVTDRIAAMVRESKFAEHVRGVMLQGVTFAGFNVVDAVRLHEVLSVPVIVVARRTPDLPTMRAALERLFDNGAERYARIEALGPMQAIGDVAAQWVGTDRDVVADTIGYFAVNGLVPEPLRTAHLVAGAIVDGASRGRA
jgi:endonuclease V-like protein UPF0215 family